MSCVVKKSTSLGICEGRISHRWLLLGQYKKRARTISLQDRYGDVNDIGSYTEVRVDELQDVIEAITEMSQVVDRPASQVKDRNFTAIGLRLAE